MTIKDESIINLFNFQLIKNQPFLLKKSQGKKIWSNISRNVQIKQIL